MRERDIQDAFQHWLREREIPFVRPRMDKASTIRKGWPDFSVFWCGRVVFIETKTETGKLSKDQKDCISFLQKNGCRVEIARSVEQCCEAARSILTEAGRATDALKSFPDVIRERFAETKATVAAVGADDENVSGMEKFRCQRCGGHGDNNVDGECIACDGTGFKGEKSEAHIIPPPANGKRKLFLGNIGPTPYVFEGSGSPGSAAKMLRKATPADLMELRQG